MLVANLFHLRKTNGLFYFALDYLRDNQDLMSAVLVKAEMLEAVRGELPKAKAISCNTAKLFVEICRARSRGDFIFTPTPHPYPFLSKQLVVLHDPYPFIGRVGRVKRLLLQVSLQLSQCHVGYINRSEALAFLHTLRLHSTRLIFTPNRFPDVIAGVARKVSMHDTFRIGLVGTDSPKKNYEQLFRALLTRSARPAIEFIAYGHDTSYLRGIRKAFPDIPLHLSDSDENDLTDFFAEVDLLVSAAHHEGFGRPLAGAMMTGVPCLLLRQPVFEEFFGECASFATNMEDLVDQLLERASSPHQARAVPLVAPSDLVVSYRDAVALVRRLSDSRLPD